MKRKGGERRKIGVREQRNRNKDKKGKGWSFGMWQGWGIKTRISKGN